MVGPIMTSLDETGGFGPIDETDRAVVAKEQVVGDVADRRSACVATPANGQHELVLGRRESDRTRLLLGPSEEAPEPGPELEQPPIIVVGDVARLDGGRGRHGKYRTTI
jgi:hypothetical protein